VPVFKDNYYTYTRNEFLLDSDVQFFKLKKFMEKNPKVLKEDPIVGIDYMKIIGMIKRKKMLENTADPFKPEHARFQWHYDI